VVIEGPLASAWPLADGRWVITREWSDESDLLLHDPRSGTEELLAADVERAFVDPLPQTSWDVCPDWISADKLHEEIRWVDVAASFRRRRIGTALVEAAEALATQRSSVVGIGVGMDADYGPAQAMYVRRGYVPDARGLTSHIAACAADGGGRSRW
jgi:GNAT superfamily N-acetyltransferase